MDTKKVMTTTEIIEMSQEIGKTYWDMFVEEYLERYEIKKRIENIKVSAHTLV